LLLSNHVPAERTRVLWQEPNALDDSPDVVAQIRERVLNPCKTPVAILRRLTNNQLPNPGHHRWPPRPRRWWPSYFRAIKLPRQASGAHNGPDLPEHSTPQVLRLGGQANALIVGEAQPIWSELLAEHAVLRLEIIHHLALLLVDPASQGNNEEPERVRQRKHDVQGSRSTKNRLTIELPDTTGLRQ
jgi:hypothetical protein